mgnify:FL=1
MPGNLFALFQSRFPADRSRPFIVVPDGATLSYADLEARSAQFAHVLVANGVKPGDRVAVQVDKSPEAIFVYLACLRAGAVLLPLNTAYQPDELAFFLSDAAPAAVICQPAREAQLGGIVARTGITATLLTLGADGSGTLVAQAAAMPAEFATLERVGTEIASILYSSGTTGRPKGEMMSNVYQADNELTLL